MKILFKIIMILVMLLICLNNMYAEDIFLRSVTPLIAFMLGLLMTDMLKEFDNDI